MSTAANDVASDADPAGPVASPDGRFEVVVREEMDRWEVVATTTLRERATGERLFECGGAPAATFGGDGLLVVRFPGYESGGVTIDPARRAFRVRADEPWVPLAAWPLVEHAYNRGWGQAMSFRFGEHGSAAFPWTTLGLFLFAVMGVVAFALVPPFNPRDAVMRAALVVVAGAAGLLFGGLTAVAVREWLIEQRYVRRVAAQSQGKPVVLSPRRRGR